MQNNSYQTTFDLIGSEFTGKFSYVLIGGFAVNNYGVTRQTLDVDFMLAGTDYPKALDLLRKFGYQEHMRSDIFARLSSPKRTWMDIDFMFVDQETLAPILADAKQVTIAGHSFSVPSLDHLIALKLHSVKHNRKIREYKDLVDILRLIEKNRLDVKSESFRNLCLKFGNPELYDEILKRIE